MKKKTAEKIRKHGYTVLQWTWGLPQTLLGAALYAVHRKDDHFDYRGAKATAWNKDTGISLGKFIFVPSGSRGRSHASVKKSEAPADPFLLDHEYGHTLQSLILGPFYLLFVGVPSIIWNRSSYFRRKRIRSGKSYYSAPFESSANTLASKFQGKNRR